MSAPARSDIELLVPAPPKVAERVRPDVTPSVAPLFAGNRAARTLPDELSTLEGAAAGAVPTARSIAEAAGARREAAAARYQDYASQRRRNRSSGGSGGSGAFSGGGFGGGGSGGGVSGTAPRRGNSGSTPAATRAANTGSNRPAREETRVVVVRDNTIGDNTGAPVLPAVAAPAASLGAGNAAGGGLGNGPSPASAPEPLTLLLVGSGLAGLYGARKHFAG